MGTGPLSSTVLELLRCAPPQGSLTPVDVPVADADPYGLDLQLALYVCYELHYRGFAGVDPRWEWNPALLALRAQLEEVFLSAVRNDIGDIGADERAEAEMDALCVEPVDGTGPSYYLRDKGTWLQMQEYFVHRSLYHLKEGDPHAWAIPRLTGQAKASFVAIEFDEYGGGRAGQVHQQLFADLHGRGWAGFVVPRLPRRRAGGFARGGQPDVDVRFAPGVAWCRDRAFRID